MKLRHIWLLALLSILTLMTTSTMASAEETATSGHIEIGISGMDTDDSPARVNEYVNTRSEEGFSFSPSLSLESISEGSSFGLDVDLMGPRDQEINLEFDASRIFKFGFDHQVLEHWKDHDNLLHLGATLRNDAGGDQPRVTTDATVGQLGVDTIAEANERYAQEMDNDYIVTRRETEAESSLHLPALPNIEFHAGMRIETRQGQEQAITASKCNQCHVQANANEIDERTEDFTFGATGKFGQVTVEYDYLHREFTEDGADPTYNFLSSPGTHGGVADADQLLYSGSQSYKVTPDSKKDMHHLKARVDIDSNSSVTAAYVNAEVESDKEGEDGTYSIDTDTLTSEFESFFLKGATKIGGLRLSVRGGTYEVDTSDYTLTYTELIGATNIGIDGYDTVTGEVEYESSEAREVTEFGIDGVYRLARGTTLRLGYEYEEIDRQEEELNDTKTNSFKVSIKSRFNRKLSGRVSYQYQDISDPLNGAHTGILQSADYLSSIYPGLATGTTTDFIGDAGNTDNGDGTGFVFYWNSVYPNRMLETSVDPENVHEIKLASTWAPSANMAATIFARVRMEDNDSVKYKQDSYVPGISFYYAPSDKINLTMSYTFNKQDTENRICVGWYHG
ncbi:Putative outer membrane beta-barrel porin, MtrB/PioB [Desulfuromusa kysingii]|uniref:Putative outer membrane beta-barrel porin, MtrB/PioB n=2 Tax=Desulfuromusa kysingii TaxID=37625 RepID=A0A1H3WAA8_9BACT|nr:Putative outer membrane beta-barrel porin, MtrB/PioB [Desulfuromusa kysingii]